MLRNSSGRLGGLFLATLLALSAACGGAADMAPEAPRSYADGVTGGMAAPGSMPPAAYPEPALAEEQNAPASYRTADKESIDDDSGATYAKSAPAKAPAQQPQPAKPADSRGPQGGKGGEGDGKTASAVEDPARKQPILIYTADFTMSVYEVTKSLDAVESVAKGAGGYLSRRDDRSITVRIPAEKFAEVVAAIEKVGDVLHRNVVSEDVTAEYRDLEVQLTNALALRARFEKLLEKAAKVEEALEIERELGRITGEIERIKGRLKLLSDLARYSTVTVSFQPRTNAQVQQGPFVLPLPWLNNVGLRRLMSL